MNNYSIFLLCLFLCCPRIFATPYRSIESIRSLSPAEAERGGAVELESQIVWLDPLRGSFFINDGHTGMYVQRRLPAGEKNTLQVGDWVRIKGATLRGSFAPAILSKSVAVLGRRPLPKPKKYWADLLFSPLIDCDWMAMHGRLISYEVIEDSYVIIAEVMRDERIMYVHIPDSPQNEKRLAQLLFQWVRFNAVAGTVGNSNRQSVGRVFHVSSAQDFQSEGGSLNEALSSVSPAQPIHELMRLGMNHISITKTYGTVTHLSERELFLRGEEGALQVWMQKTPDLQTGDVVEVIGLTKPESVSPAFRACAVNVIQHGAVPEPVRLESLRAVVDKLNYDLVEIDAELVEVGYSFGPLNAKRTPKKQITLLCRSDGQLFRAKLPVGVIPAAAVQAGARLRLTGLCHVTNSSWRPWQLAVGGCWLQLRQAGDIDVIAAAPWWTPKRLFWLAGSTVGLSLFFLIWIGLLRKTVERQTEIIGEKIEQEAILDERQRIARELHDNLEQGLAGAIFQLGGFRRLYQKGLAKNKERLEQLLAGESVDRAALLDCSGDWQTDAAQHAEVLSAVEHMLRHCSEESRSSILDLRGGLLEKMSLIDAVETTLNALTAERGLPITLQVQGTPVSFSRTAERNILLVIKEAVSNAARHANPTRVDVTLDYGAGLRVTVIDDGSGFEVATQLRSGRFGLPGMQERMNNLKGELRIESVLGKGTTVIARLLGKS